MESVVVAYSGGIDSTLVAVVAHRVLGPRALAVTAVSPALAARELDEATGLARRFGFSHKIIHTKEMEREGYVANSSRRCYFCKTELYADLRKLAQDRDYAWIANGTNTDDLGNYRPGLQAASEHQVPSPMVETGLSKEIVRRLARDLGIPTWDKPAQPCLSSRIPYGTAVTVEALSRIERAEEYLWDLGLREVRVRHHDRLCRYRSGGKGNGAGLCPPRGDRGKPEKGRLPLGVPGPGGAVVRQPQRPAKINRVGPASVNGAEGASLMPVAYIQSVGGASGDMLLGALLDLGFSLDTLRQELAWLDLDGYGLTLSQEARREVRGTRLTVAVEGSPRHSPRALLALVENSALAAEVKTRAGQVLTSLWRAESRVHGQPQEALELEELGSIDTLYRCGRRGRWAGGVGRGPGVRLTSDAGRRRTA